VDDDEGGFNSGLAGGYSWEEEYRRSWEILQEDESGSLRGVVAQLQQQLKRRRQVETRCIIESSNCIVTRRLFGGISGSGIQKRSNGASSAISLS